MGARHPIQTAGLPRSVGNLNHDKLRVSEFEPHPARHCLAIIDRANKLEEESCKERRTRPVPRQDSIVLHFLRYTLSLPRPINPTTLQDGRIRACPDLARRLRSRHGIRTCNLWAWAPLASSAQPATSSPTRML